MTATSSFLKYLKADPVLVAAFGDEMYQNKIPENKPYPYLWFATAGKEKMDELGPASKILRQFVDVEVVSGSVEQASDLADVVDGQLSAVPAGAFGDGHIAGVDVSDQSDDYVPRNAAADAGASVAALTVELILYEE